MNGGQLGILARLIFFVALELGIQKSKLVEFIDRACWREEHALFKSELRVILDWLTD